MRDSRLSLQRRTFLQTSLIAGAASALPAFSLGEPVPAPQPQSPVKPFELDEATIADLQAAMSAGKYTAHAITEKYLARIEEVDKNGPKLASVLETNPDALAIADALDKERKDGHVRGPMHGIPVLIKDNIDTADQMQTTAGSLALLGSKPVRDSGVAQKLREAGAIILGKTNLSEWANIRSSHSSSGWSGRGGQCKNPYALDRNPCGSSSGSGAAASANLCTVAIGTETDGSVVCPSSANGLVGIKPTLGLVSRAGIIPISHSQDTAGPMARTVRDAAILLGALQGVDQRDEATAASAGKTPADYTRFLDPNGLRGTRIGVARKYFWFSPCSCSGSPNSTMESVDQLFSSLFDQMKHAGAEIVDPADLPTFGKFDDTEFQVLLYELKADLNAYLAGRPGAPKSLQEIIDFNEKNRDKEMPYFGQDIFLMSQAKGPLTDEVYVKALAANHQLSRTEGIDALMDKYKLDAIVAPTAGPAWTTDLLNGDHSLGGSSNAAAVAGYPDITVPAGNIYGLPVGISFFGRAWSEPTLLKIAYGFEQMTKARKTPQFLATLGI